MENNIHEIPAETEEPHVENKEISEEIPKTETRQGYLEEINIASDVVQIQYKRYYLDIKENKFGVFLKIVEVPPIKYRDQQRDGNRPKTRIVFSMDKVIEFRNALTEFGEFYASLGPINNANTGRVVLKKECIMSRNRKYWLDLVENEKGRYLRVTQVLTRNNERSFISLPAQGIIEMRNKLTQLIEHHATPNDISQAALKLDHMQLGSKRLFLDLIHTPKGRFLRMSEQKKTGRCNIHIPEASIEGFKDLLVSFLEQSDYGNNNQEPGCSVNVKTEIES